MMTVHMMIYNTPGASRSSCPIGRTGHRSACRHRGLGRIHPQGAAKDFRVEELEKMADEESESGMESGWESDGGNELRMAARLGQQLLRQKQELAARLKLVEDENERMKSR